MKSSNETHIASKAEDAQTQTASTPRSLHDQQLAFLDMANATAMILAWTACSNRDLQAYGEWSCDWREAICVETRRFEEAKAVVTELMEASRLAADSVPSGNDEHLVSPGKPKTDS